MGNFNADTVARLSERSGEPAMLADRRRAAFERFEALPWPDQTAEEWHNTDIRSLDIERFDPFPPAHAPVNALEDLPEEVRAVAIGETGDRLGLAVRMDADLVHLRLAPALSEQGVILAPMHDVAIERPELIENWLGRAGVSNSERKFAEMNAAFGLNVSFVYVPKGVTVELPLQVVRWITRGGIGIFPRIVIIADEGSSLTYIDHFASGSLDGESLAVANVEIYAEQGARVDYLAVQDWAQSVWHFQTTRAVVGRDATVRTLAATLGGAMSRTVAQAVLDGQGAHADMLGVYFGDHAQKIDNRTLQLHRAPHTTSDLYYKGAMKGTSRAVFSGLVDIEKDGEQAEAATTNRNLLLSPGASALPAPFLEINTSEVTRASHAVSVGRPDAEVLFYLHSRGLDPAEAERLYVKGFFQEIIDRVPVPQIRAALEAAVEAELALED